MIKLIKNSEINKTTRYRFYGDRCNCCNRTDNVNVLEVTEDNSNTRTLISICDKCLQELKKKIESLEDEDERD
nr:MAG TPA: Protein involved in formate dehydrogenase formation [Caudoviricetes sp.]